MYKYIRPNTSKNQNSKTLPQNKSFHMQEGKKSKVCELICEILFNKYITLKRRKNDVMEFVRKKLNNELVNNDLKISIEKEAFDLFAVAPDKKSIPIVQIQKIQNDEQFLSQNSKLTNQSNTPTQNDHKKLMNTFLFDQNNSSYSKVFNNNFEYENDDESNIFKKLKNIDIYSKIKKNQKLNLEEPFVEKFEKEKNNVKLCHQINSDKTKIINYELKISKNDNLPHEIKEKDNQKSIQQENKNKFIKKQSIDYKNKIDNIQIFNQYKDKKDNPENLISDEFYQKFENIKLKNLKMTNNFVHNIKEAELRKERRQLALKLENENNEIKIEKSNRQKIIKQRKLIQDYLKKQTREKRDTSADNKQRELQKLNSIALDQEKNDENRSNSVDRTISVNRQNYENIKQKKNNIPKLNL